MAIFGQIQMSCDWILGASFYGFIAKYVLFCQKKIFDHPERETESDDVEYEDNLLFKSCWKLFCQWNLKFNNENYGPFSCFLGFGDMPGKYDAVRPVDSCFVTFGHEFSNGMNLDAIKKLKEFPTNFLERISQFVYLFNETDFFGGIEIGNGLSADFPGSNGFYTKSTGEEEEEKKEEKEGKIKKVKLEDETVVKYDTLRKCRPKIYEMIKKVDLTNVKFPEDKMVIWNSVMNGEESGKVSRVLPIIQSLFVGPQVFCGVH